jgi:hypothetical protein
MTNVKAAEPPPRRQRTGTRLYAKNVARAADRMEEPRLAIRFQLTSQVGHEHLDRVRHRKGVVAPDLIEQPLARDHDPLVPHQVLEQLELALRQLQPPLAASDLMRVGVEAQVADRDRASSSCR